MTLYLRPIFKDYRYHQPSSSFPIYKSQQFLFISNKQYLQIQFICEVNILKIAVRHSCTKIFRRKYFGKTSDSKMFGEFDNVLLQSKKSRIPSTTNTVPNHLFPRATFSVRNKHPNTKFASV
jgi:hypothetical protein